MTTSPAAPPITPSSPEQEKALIKQQPESEKPLVSLEVKKAGRPSIYPKETWDIVKDLVENHPEKSLVEIAKEVGMPLSTLESKSGRDGWLNRRDITKVRVAEQKLSRITREIAFQLNDMYQHTSAMIEALQYSHRIRMWKDDEGNIHYSNFDDWPDRPSNWGNMSDEEKDSYRRFISPVRLRNFLSELDSIFGKKRDILDFIAKITKPTLPKADPDIISITRREVDEEKIHNTKIFEYKPKEDLAEISKQLDDDEGAQ
jgi:hypothetical protein